MKVKSHYMRKLKRPMWSAFTTLNRMDIREYGATEKEAREKLARRIANSDFLLEGIKVNI